MGKPARKVVSAILYYAGITFLDLGSYTLVIDIFDKLYTKSEKNLEKIFFIMFLFTSKHFSPLSSIVGLLRHCFPLYLLLLIGTICQGAITTIQLYRYLNDYKEVIQKKSFLIYPTIYSLITGFTSYFHLQSLAVENSVYKEYIFGVIPTIGSLFYFLLTPILGNFISSEKNIMKAVHWIGIALLANSLVLNFVSGFWDLAKLKGPKTKSSLSVFKIILFSIVFLSGFDFFLAFLNHRISFEFLFSDTNPFYLFFLFMISMSVLLIWFPNNKVLSYKAIIYLIIIVTILQYIIIILANELKQDSLTSILDDFLTGMYYFGYTMPIVIIMIIYKKHDAQTAINTSWIVFLINYGILCGFSSIFKGDSGHFQEDLTITTSISIGIQVFAFILSIFLLKFDVDDDLISLRADSKIFNLIEDL